jgi:hypothetical protein
MISLIKKSIGQYYKMYIAASLFFCLGDLAKAQCIYSPVIASDYFSADCGDNKMQHLIDVKAPVYGNSGGLFFTSPLTDNSFISSITDVTNITLRIYPNPALYNVTLDWPGDENAILFIASSLGQIISYTPIESYSKNTLDVQHLTPGYYIIKVVTTSNKTYLTKLIKQ